MKTSCLIAVGVFACILQKACCQPSENQECNYPPDPGPCDGYYPLIFYDFNDDTCKDFVYGGCWGNANIFQSVEECESVCGKKVPSSSPDCSSPPDAGSCKHKSIQIFFDVDDGTCKQFAYSGCGGNENRFESVQECQSVCGGFASSSSAFREDLRCGEGYTAPNGEVAQCDPNGIYPCCSPGKWCGNTAAHCTCAGCVDYSAFREDLRCGEGYTAPNGKVAQCDPNGIYPCCSMAKWCGNTAAHCTCAGCVDYRN